LHIPNDSAKQWVIPQSVQILVAGLLFLSSFLCEESPRYLCKIGDWHKAKEALGNLWSLPALHPDVITVIEEIHEELETDQNQTMRQSWLKSIKELLTVKSNQQRLLFVFSTQILAQWSGANSITST
jgi:hypothetical protein